MYIFLDLKKNQQAVHKLLDNIIRSFLKFDKKLDKYKIHDFDILR